MDRVASLAPPSLRMRSEAELLFELERRLAEDYSLPMVGAFTVAVEGWTDVGYLQRASELYLRNSGVDLLKIGQNGGLGTISVITPGRPGDPSRGGTPQMVRLAETLRPYVFILEAFLGFMFVFDHDDEGCRAADQVTSMGYRKGINVMTLDPKVFAGACAKKQVKIEDLLSRHIQNEFFRNGGTTCSVEYCDGVLTRFDWGYHSKGLLKEFVCREGALEDFREIIDLLKRIRHAFGCVIESNAIGVEQLGESGSAGASVL